ncbi:MAG TPA: hypothetical protein VFF81_06385, partial [Noviherbaspirillum sp.]|nr:hypothetical protein [Noviherbaspirillum sp.]
LHLHCAEVIHHDLPWNPAKLEQRIGRIDRVNSLADSTPGATIAIGIPFLEQNYEKFQYDVVLSRAQKFEVLLGRPDYRTAETEEENFDAPEANVQASRDADVGRADEILVALPDGIVDYLKIDLTLAGRA